MQFPKQTIAGLGMFAVMALTLTACNSQDATKKLANPVKAEVTGFESWTVTDTKQTKQAIASARTQLMIINSTDSDLFSEGELKAGIDLLASSNRDLSSKINNGDISAENGKAIDAEINVNKMKIEELQHVLAFKFVLAGQAKTAKDAGDHDLKLFEAFQYSYKYLSQKTTNEIAANVLISNTIDKSLVTSNVGLRLVLSAQKAFYTKQREFLTDKKNRYTNDYKRLAFEI